MKIISYDSVGQPIRKHKDFYIWKCSNGYYQITKNSIIPFELGDHITFIEGLQGVKNYLGKTI